MIDGGLWAWGHGLSGQLGLGDTQNSLVPVWVGAEEEFGGSPVLMAACGNSHTLAVTKAGTLWSWGVGDDGRLGHNDDNNRLVPTQVEAQHFGRAKIVSAAAGESHSGAVTQHGCLYTWGQGTRVGEEDEEDHQVPLGLGHGDGARKLVTTRVAPVLLQRALQCVAVCCCSARASATPTRCRLHTPSPSPWATIPGWAAVHRLRRLLLTTAKTVRMC